MINFEQVLESGHLLAIPVAVIDVALYVAFVPANAIDIAAQAVHQLVKFILNKKDKSLLAIPIKAELALATALYAPLRLILTPIHLTYQICASVYNPAEVKSFNRLSFNCCCTKK